MPYKVIKNQKALLSFLRNFLKGKRDGDIEVEYDRNRVVIEISSPKKRKSSIVDELYGCLGEEKVEDYDFHLELKRFGGEADESR